MQRYQQTWPWNLFKNIREFDVTGVNKVTTDTQAKETVRYDGSGRLLTAPAKGLNIVRYSDGTEKKIFTK